MKRATLNHAYRLVWSTARDAYVAVPESAHARGKAASGLALLVLAGLLAGGLAHQAHASGTLPTGGVVSAGTGSISQSGSTMTIQQTSARMAIDWNAFSIGAGNTVNFVQPSASAVALNRVLGSDVSVIQGALRANGQVFLINPNGILFSPSAQVNVGSLVASTLNLSNADFMAGRYRFEGSSSNAVVNQGNISAANGGAIALIAARITNSGTLNAPQGQVLMGAGSKVTLDLGGPVRIEVTQGALDALIEQGGAIRADGGLVYLTAKATNQLMTTVINHTGITEARTLATGQQGQITLLGDMTNGQINVGGTLDASALGKGNGGFIETSAAQVDTRADLRVTAGATQGSGGTWLIDPYDYIINSTAASNIVSALNTGTSVTVTTASSNTSYGAQATTNGDITVASAIAKSAGGDATLTLRADRNIIVNSDIGATVGKLNLTLSAANAASATVGGVNINANLSSNGGNILIGGAAGTATNGIGYALNSDSSSAAVTIQQNKALSSAGGNIVINGRSTATGSGSYSGTKGGIYVKSGASVNSGGGNIFMSGISTADTKVFGFGIEGNSGTVTTFTTSGSTGTILVDAQNTLNANGALGLLNNGNQTRVQFSAPSVAHMLFKINGSSQLTSFTMSPPCGTAYPNCGTLLVPGANNSYLYGSYQAVNMATHAMYVFTGSGSKTYDGNTNATGLSITTLGAPAGFTTGGLAFHTASKNAGTYSSLVNDAANPNTYTSSGTDYAVAYFYDPYTVTPKTITPSAANKVYDGTTAASVTSSGVLAGDTVNFNYTSGNFASKDAGSGIGVTVSGINLSGTDAANYTISSTTLNTTANITARPLNLSGSRVYDGSLAVAASALNLGNLVAGEDLVLSGSGSVANKNAATGKTLTQGTLNVADGSTGKASNYTFSGGSLTVDITKAGLTVSGLSAQNKVYDGSTAATLTGSAALAGVIGSDSVSVNGGAAMTGTFADKNAGTAKAVSASLGGISLTGGDADNYQVTGFASPLTADITKATLTVSGLAAQNKVYDGSTAATLTGSATLAGIIGSDTVNLSGSAPTSGAFADKNAGTAKTVTASLAGLGLAGGDADNYQIGGLTTPLAANITKATLTVSGLAAQNKVYDGSTAATLTGTAALAGVIGSDTVNLSGSAPSSGTFADKNVGTAKTVTASLASLGLAGGDADNYQIGGLTAPLAANITKATLTVSGLAAQNKVYDGSTAATLTGTAALAGVIGSDTVNLSGSAPTSGAFADKNVGTAKTVTASLAGLGLAGGDADNYQIGGLTAPLAANITKATLTVSGLSAQNKVYDGSTAATLTGSATLAGVIGSDTVNLSGSAPTSGAFADKNVGTAKTVTASLAGLGLAGGDADNYQIGGLTAPLAANITKATLTVSGLAAQNKVYDGSTAATLTGTAALAGVIGSDSVSVNGAAAMTGTFADKNVGTTKAVSASLGGISLTGSDADNYQVTGFASPLTADITPRAITLSSLTAANKAYDGNRSATLNGASFSNLVAGETLTLAGSGTFADANAGVGKTVTVSDVTALTLGNGTGLASNYQLTTTGSASTTATITPRTITLASLQAANKTYDGSAATTITGGNFNNLVGGETLAITGSANFANAAAGNGKTVTVGDVSALSLGNGTGLASNYQLTTSGSFNTAADIARRPVTATANNLTLAYTGTPFSGGAGVSYSGLLPGESLGTVSYGGSSQGATAAGSYAITPQGLVNPNYLIAYANGMLTITAPAEAPRGTADPQQYMPKPVVVPQFTAPTVSLAPSTSTRGTMGSPGGLNYVPVQSFGSETPLAAETSTKASQVKETVTQVTTPNSATAPLSVFVVSGGINAAFLDIAP